MISDMKSFEYCLLNYVPSILSEEKVAMAVIVFDSTKQTYRMRIASDWNKRVLALDEGSDLESLGIFLKDIGRRLAADPVMTMNQLEDSLSNTIQISERRNAEIGLTSSAIENFAAAILRHANAPGMTAIDGERQTGIRFNSTEETVGV